MLVKCIQLAVATRLSLLSSFEQAHCLCWRSIILNRKVRENVFLILSKIQYLPRIQHLPVWTSYRKENIGCQDDLRNILYKGLNQNLISVKIHSNLMVPISILKIHIQLFKKNYNLVSDFLWNSFITSSSLLKFSWHTCFMVHIFHLN